VEKWYGYEVIRHVMYRGKNMPVIRANVDFGMDEKNEFSIIGHKMEIMLERNNYGYLRDGRAVKCVKGEWECLI